MGRENAGRVEWEVLKPPTPLQVYSEHRSGLGRQRVLGKKSIRKGASRDRAGVR